MWFLSSTKQNSFHFVCMLKWCSQSKHQDAVQPHCCAPLCSPAQPSPPGTGPAEAEQSAGSNNVKNTSLWLNQRIPLNLKHKCLKPGQVCGETRTGVPCPLQEHPCSVVILPHVAVGVCRAGSCIWLAIDHVIHHSESTLNKRADWQHETQMYSESIFGR